MTAQAAQELRTGKMCRELPLQFGPVELISGVRRWNYVRARCAGNGGRWAVEAVRALERNATGPVNDELVLTAIDTDGAGDFSRRRAAETRDLNVREAAFADLDAADEAGTAFSVIIREKQRPGRVRILSREH